MQMVVSRLFCGALCLYLLLYRMTIWTEENTMIT